MDRQAEEIGVLQAFMDDPRGFYVVLNCGREYEVIDRLIGHDGPWLKLHGSRRRWVHLRDVVGVAADVWMLNSEAQG